VFFNLFAGRLFEQTFGVLANKFGLTGLLLPIEVLSQIGTVRRALLIGLLIYFKHLSCRERVCLLHHQRRVLRQRCLYLVRLLSIVVPHFRVGKLLNVARLE
jgi:hypothetical protein